MSEVRTPNSIFFVYLSICVELDKNIELGTKNENITKQIIDLLAENQRHWESLYHTVHTGLCELYNDFI